MQIPALALHQFVTEHWPGYSGKPALIDSATGRALTYNVYGRDPLTALNTGTISTAQFLDLNKKIGGYDNDGNLIANRAVADPQALRAAYQTGHVTNGGNGLARLPIIDVRGYTDLTEKGDVHQKYHSYSLRERLRAANSVILVAPAPPLEKILRAKPAGLTDACYDAAGNRLTEPQNFSGGECNKLYPTFPPPRMIAGGPITNNVLNPSTPLTTP